VRALADHWLLQDPWLVQQNPPADTRAEGGGGDDGLDRQSRQGCGVRGPEGRRGGDGLCGPPIAAELAARAAAAEQGKTYISPYNDRDVMAGQGTMGLELLEQQPELDAVFLSVGGGGLIGGLGTAVKTLRPATQIVGVWPENSAAMLRSLEAGEIVEAEERPTLSTSTAGAVEPGAVTFDVCRHVIDTTIEVSEAEIAAAMAAIARHDQWMVEGAAGVPLAGLVKQAQAWRDKKVAIVLCGRNIALETFLAAVP